jgi:hypothetical protein
MWKQVTFCVVGIASIVSAVRPAAAQVGPSSQSAPSAQAAASSPSDLDLAKLLSRLGFEPRDTSPAGDGSICEIRTRRGEREVVVRLSLADEGRTVRFDAEPCEGRSAAGMTAEDCLQVLDFNRENLGGKLVIRDDRLLLSQSLEAADATPAGVRKALDQFDSSVRRAAVLVGPGSPSTGTASDVVRETSPF